MEQTPKSLRPRSAAEREEAVQEVSTGPICGDAGKFLQKKRGYASLELAR